MNWGKKLIIVFMVFAAGMSYLVYRCMHVNIELVSKEYYKDELKYEDIIESTKTANALSGKVTLIQHDAMITVKLPTEMQNKEVTGTIWFYCAADASRDRHIPLSTGVEASQQINKKLLLPGDYSVKFDWISNNKHYHTEQPFRIL
jgi:hypothetical protein